MAVGFQPLFEPGEISLIVNALELQIAWRRRGGGVEKRVRCQTIRHSFATNLLKRGHDSEQSRVCPERSRRQLLGHRDVLTAMIYTHVLRHGVWGVRSLWTSIKPHRTPLKAARSVAIQRQA